MEAHAKDIPLSRQMCASYDAYIASLPFILHRHKVDITRYVFDGEKQLHLDFVGAKLERPKFLEADGTSHEVGHLECLQRNLSYSLPLYTSVHVNLNGKTEVFENVYLGKIPLMIGSKHDPGRRICPHDPGGYFIVKGSEKTIVFQKAHIHNCTITLHRISNGADSFAVCCKSEGTGVAVTTIKWNGRAMVSFPKMKEEITVGTLLQHLPATKFVSLTNEENAFFQESLEQKSDISIQDTFLLGEEDDDRMENVLSFCVPHTKYKADYILLMMKQLYRDIHAKQWSDKDSLMFQRIEMVHDLLSGLTHHLLNKMTHTMYQFLHKKMTGNIQKRTILKLISRTTTITDGLQFALGTGNWNTPSFDGRQRVGVAQLLQRGTVYTAISQLRRVSSSIKPEQKLSKPRFLHGTHRGRLCYLETPEGASVGLESQLSLGAYVSITTPSDVIRELVCDIEGPLLVLINGGIVGYGSEEVARVVRSARRSGQISKDVSVTVNDATVCVPNVSIRTCSGRICRPLYILPRKSSKGMTFTQMLSEGIVEYLDVYEEDTIHVGTTHEEIDPSLMLGFCVGTTPYSDRNPAPRNTYQAAMLKQAQSVNSIGFLDRFDTTTNVLHYGQKPLVSTEVERVYPHALPTGINAIVAIMPFEYNQEDSIVVNRYSVDRGFGRCTQLKTTKDVLCSDESYIDLPPLNRLVKKGDNLLEKRKNGYRKVGGKRVAYEKTIHVEAMHDGVVDKVFVYKERNGSDACKVRVRKARIPTVGDKFASRSAQKGTVGMLVRGEDLPFTLDGITPDIILNPHAIPSRMTMAQILECLKSKYGSYMGIQDGSPFNGDTAEGLMEMLHTMGFARNGTQVMQSGITGERYQVPIFIGPTFYQRLKHNAEDKTHARGRGRTCFLTRQPNEGRANGGALRVGEMEKDALLAHSVPHVLVERLMHSSDAYEMSVCACGLTHSVRGGVCNRCDSAAKTMIVPYAFKLLVQELQAMCIEVKLK
jgi:DNA-directed RNA polymerase II subunit RPB2